MLTQMGIYGPIAQTLPPLIIGTVVQVVNMPLVRATITIQDPKSDMKNTWAALVYIYNTRGVSGLWHGVSAGILKTVPKYVTAIVVKDFMEDHLPHGDSKDKTTQLTRSAIKAVTAGMAGAILTNPLDVIRNE
jgi:Mitochondrial carrier protein